MGAGGMSTTPCATHTAVLTTRYATNTIRRPLSLGTTRKKMHHTYDTYDRAVDSIVETTVMDKIYETDMMLDLAQIPRLG